MLISTDMRTNSHPCKLAAEVCRNLGRRRRDVPGGEVREPAVALFLAPLIEVQRIAQGIVLELPAAAPPPPSPPPQPPDELPQMRSSHRRRPLPHPPPPLHGATLVELEEWKPEAAALRRRRRRRRHPCSISGGHVVGKERGVYKGLRQLPSWKRQRSD